MINKRVAAWARYLMLIVGLSAGAILTVVLVLSPFGDDQKTPEEVEKGTSATMNRETTQDDLLVRVNNTEPTFAGAIVDSRGELNIWLTDPSNEKARRVQRVLTEIDATIYADREYSVHSARYTFADLYQWKDDLSDLHLVVPGQVSAAISIRRNRIELGVTDARVKRAEIDAELARRDIPRDSVLVVEEQPGRGF